MRLTPLLSRLSIIDKAGLLVPLSPNWAQQAFIEAVESTHARNVPTRIIVLKARQLGLSTITEAVIFIKGFIDDNTRAAVVGSELDNAQHLLSMTQTYWDTYPFKRLYTPKYQSKNELAWKETGSSIRVSTAKNAKVGRGKTIRALHASEVAFWDNAGETMLALNQAIPNLPGTMIVLESTANGVGNWFYNQWKAAEDGDTDYIPLFFPWYKHPEYRASQWGMEYKSLGQLDSEERNLRNIGVSDDALTWRRWAIRNLCDNDLNKFHQEYPTTPDEAFIATGTNVFPHGKLSRVYEPLNGQRGRLTREPNGSVRFQPDIAGPLVIFRWPAPDEEWGQYFVGGDPTHTVRGDFACAQVISRRTLEQVAVFRQRMDPGTFGQELALLGDYYNQAAISSEVEGPGYSTIATLIALNYPYVWFNRVADRTPGKHTDHYGWRTTAQSKHLAIGTLLKFVVDSANTRDRGYGLDTFTIHDKQTYQEMRDYITLDDGGYGPAGDSDYDDTVMALAIAVTCHYLEPPLRPYEKNIANVDVGSGGRVNASDPPWTEWGEMGT